MLSSRFTSSLSLALFVSSVAAGPCAPDGWSLSGCYVSNNKLLSKSISFANQPDVTWEKCATACGSSYTYFGIDSGYTCYCGTSLGGTPQQAPDADCWYLCSGDASQWCGGPSRIEVFSKAGATLGSSSSSASPKTTTSSSSSTKTTKTTTSPTTPAAPTTTSTPTKASVTSTPSSTPSQPPTTTSTTTRTNRRTTTSTTSVSIYTTAPPAPQPTSTNPPSVITTAPPPRGSTKSTQAPNPPTTAAPSDPPAGSITGDGDCTTTTQRSGTIIVSCRRPGRGRPPTNDVSQANAADVSVANADAGNDANVGVDGYATDYYEILEGPTATLTFSVPPQVATGDPDSVVTWYKE